MATLLVTVDTPRDGRSRYRFEGQRIRVGRLSDCDLSVCHEAMPRELCAAWIEDDGRTIRVEERPNLTNPLIVGKAIVKGGVSGGRLEFTVGPIALRFEADGVAVPTETGTPGAKRKWLRILPVSAIAIALTGFFFWNKEDPLAARDRFSDWPADPFCPLAEERCALSAACREKARLLLTRARDLNSRPGTDIGRQKRAAVFLRRAVRLLRLSEMSPSGALVEEAVLSERVVKTAYRREVAALRELVRRGRDGANAALAARRVSAYLGACHGRELAWLRVLERRSQPPLEGE